MVISLGKATMNRLCYARQGGRGGWSRLCVGLQCQSAGVRRLGYPRSLRTSPRCWGRAS